MKELLNNSSKAKNGFCFTSRLFCCYLSYASFLFSIVGIFVGIKYISSPGIYGIMIVFILQFSELLQWCLRQVITM
jgi:hypothetical protein